MSGARSGTAAVCANHLARQLAGLRQKFRLTDDECASLLAGMLVSLCTRNGADPRKLIEEASAAAREA